LEKEQELLNNLQRTVAVGRERPEIVGIDPGDQSVFSEQKESMFAESHRHTTLLNKVREALKRIEEGTYGRCIEDGETIPEARLHVVPWTPTVCSTKPNMTSARNGTASKIKYPATSRHFGEHNMASRRPA
jgi:DnaK suppressor protein